jgi:ribonuclease HI
MPSRKKKQPKPPQKKPLEPPEEKQFEPPEEKQSESSQNKQSKPFRKERSKPSQKSRNTIKIYVDGSFRHRKIYEGGFAHVILDNNDEKTLFMKNVSTKNKVDNNDIELMALKYALENLTLGNIRNSNIIVFYDSDHSIRYIHKLDFYKRLSFKDNITIKHIKNGSAKDLKYFNLADKYAGIAREKLICGEELHIKI